MADAMGCLPHGFDGGCVGAGGGRQRRQWRTASKGTGSVVNREFIGKQVEDLAAKWN